MPSNPLLMRVLRNMRGISQETVAREIGKATATVAQIERGALDPSMDVKRKLAAIFGNVPTPVLFRRVEPETIQEAADLLVASVRALR